MGGSRKKAFFKLLKKKTKDITYSFKEEFDDTNDMLEIFWQHLSYKLDIDNRETEPTKEEITKALEQLKDIPRIGLLASTILVPIPGFSIGYLFLAKYIEKVSNKKVRLLPDNLNNKL